RWCGRRWVVGWMRRPAGAQGCGSKKGGPARAGRKVGVSQPRGGYRPVMGCHGGQRQEDRWQEQQRQREAQQEARRIQREYEAKMEATRREKQAWDDHVRRNPAGSVGNPYMR